MERSANGKSNSGLIAYATASYAFSVSSFGKKNARMAVAPPATQCAAVRITEGLTSVPLHNASPLASLITSAATAGKSAVGVPLMTRGTPAPSGPCCA